MARSVRQLDVEKIAWPEHESAGHDEQDVNAVNQSPSEPSESSDVTENSDCDPYWRIARKMLLANVRKLNSTTKGGAT